VFELREKKDLPVLPVLQAFLVCVDQAFRLTSSNYTSTGAEAMTEFQGRRILMNLRDMGPATPKTGFNCGILGPMPEGEGA